MSGLSDWQSRWIDTVVDMAATEPKGQHTTSHWVFIRKVLGEPRTDALPMAAAFRHVRLTRALCERVAVGWDDDDTLKRVST